MTGAGLLYTCCVDASVVFMRAERDLGFTACDAETLDHALRGTLRLGISFNGEVGDTCAVSDCS
jgi:hypothetical protein